MINNYGDLVIIDFGLALIVDGPICQTVGTD